MNLLERVLTLLRANVNTMVEKADDPEHVLRQLQQDMRNQLMQVKTQVATAIAESHKLQSRYKEKLAEAEVWQRKVEQAIHQKNDTAAPAPQPPSGHPARGPHVPCPADCQLC